MPCYIRMKTLLFRDLLWFYTLALSYMVSSLEPGTPGFLDFDNLPDTNFSCVGKVIGGYYADLETNCQMFHVCTIGQLDEPMDIRFLCLNGTVFDQETRVCERIDEVDCSKSEEFYNLNLELYGNTQPSNIEESLETEPPIIIKSTTTTTTTTTTERPKPKTTRTPSYYTTSLPSITTGSKVISTHHFPISNSPDIRFNPEEINISLNPSAPPNIRSKPVSFQQQIFANGDNRNNNNKAIITTHTSYDKQQQQQQAVNTQRVQITSSKQRPKSVVSYGLTHDEGPATPSDINYGFAYDNKQYHKETPPHQHSYQYHVNVANFKPDIPGQYRNQFRTSTYRNEHLAVTRKVPYTNSHTGVTTYKNPYITPLKPTNYHSGYKHDKPQRLQLSLPLLPTLTPLTFSSPAPFTLSRHSEAKRYTNEHLAPPRIIISASASVSDASGRRLNYSLGTIGVTPLLEQPPKSYDDYKDHDVVLDPFYHDVPKVKKTREKRETKVNHAEVIRSEQEAVDVLKFLFDWYKNHEKSTTTVVSIPVTPDDITKINDDLRPTMERPLETSQEMTSSSTEIDINVKKSDLFRRGKFNILGDVLVVTENEQKSTITSTEEYKPVQQDYVDDNYEPLTYQDGSKEKLDFDKEYSEAQVENTEDNDKILTYEDNKSIDKENSRVQVKNAFAEQPRGSLENFYEDGISKDKFNYDRTYYNGTQMHNEGLDSVVNSKINSTETEDSVIHPEIDKNSTEKPPKLSSRYRSGNSRGRSRFVYPELNHESFIDNTNIQNTSPLTTTSTTISPELRYHPEDFDELNHESFIDNTNIQNTSPLTTTSTTISPELRYHPEDFDEDTEKTSEMYTTTIDALIETTTHDPEKTTTISNEEVTTVQDVSTEYNGEVEVTTIKQIHSTQSELESVQSLELEPKAVQPVELVPPQSIKPQPDESIVKSRTRSRSKFLKPTEPALNFNSLYVNENFESKEPNYDQEHEKTTLPDKTTTTVQETSKVSEEYSTNTEEMPEYTTETITTTKKSTTTESISTLLSGIRQYLVDGSTLDAIHIFDKEMEVNEDIENTSYASTYAPTTEKDTESSLSTTTSSTVPFSLSTEEFTLQTSTETITNITPAVDPTTEKLPTTTVAPLATTATSKVSRRTRPTRPHRNRIYNRNNSKHRFSTQSFTSRPTSRRKFEETAAESTTQTVENSTNEMVTVNSITEETPTSTQVGYYVEDVPATDAPLYKSANPTQAEIPKDSTTPLSGVRPSHVNRDKPLRGFVFNCFGKELNKFYLDPRDCRLFHYCTTGYTRNQLLDMKFVCDLGTYFDYDKLICTKVKPERCL